MRCGIGLVVLAASVGLAFQSRASGSPGATARYSATQLGPGQYQYAITLTDTGTTPIGTFWYAWSPAGNYLPSPPSQVASPLNWSGSSMTGYYDGSSVLWTTGSPLQPGQSLSGFSFQSPDSPASIAGTSPFFPDAPVNTSYVYSGGPFSDAGFQIVASPVPEPAAALVPLILLLARRRS